MHQEKECKWALCQEKSKDLGLHLFDCHIKQLEKSSKMFFCEWKGCKVLTPFKYRSLLSAHTQSHLIEVLGGKEFVKFIREDVPKSTAKVTKQQIHSVKPLENDEVETNDVICNEGERLPCPVAGCNIDLAPASYRKHLQRVHHQKTKMTVRVRCKKCEKAVMIEHFSRHINGYCLAPQQESESPEKRITKTKDDRLKLLKQRRKCPFEGCGQMFALCGLQPHLKKVHNSTLQVKVKCKLCETLVNPNQFPYHLLHNCIPPVSTKVRNLVSTKNAELIKKKKEFTKKIS